MSPRMERVAQNAKSIAIAIAALTVAALAIATASVLWHGPPEPKPPEPEHVISEDGIPGLCGWAGEEVARDAFTELKDKFIPFLIWDDQHNAEAVSQDKRAVLWDASLRVLGKHIPNIQQQIGDCVSFGAANAVMYLQCVQAATEAIEYKPVFQPFIYGTSRVLVGKGRLGCNSDGSVGSWAAAAVKDYGILFADSEGVPAYSGSVAKSWGCRRSAFEKFLPVAKQFPVQAIAKVDTWQQVRDAIINGYPVTVASNQGFTMRGRVRDGKLWLTPQGTWAHQMVIIGYDPLPEPCFCILNSWGPNAHGTPPDNAPPGSFWTTAKTVDRMVKQDDSFAFSAFKGFPKNDDWNLDFLLMRGVRNANSDRGINARGESRVGSGVPEFSLSP